VSVVAIPTATECTDGAGQEIQGTKGKDFTFAHEDREECPSNRSFAGAESRDLLGGSAIPLSLMRHRLISHVFILVETQGMGISTALLRRLVYNVKIRYCQSSCTR
jgi:hypothetical protein